MHSHPPRPRPSRPPKLLTKQHARGTDDDFPVKVGFSRGNHQYSILFESEITSRVWIGLKCSVYLGEQRSVFGIGSMI